MTTEVASTVAKTTEDAVSQSLLPESVKSALIGFIKGCSEADDSLWFTDVRYWGNKDEAVDAKTRAKMIALMKSIGETIKPTTRSIDKEFRDTYRGELDTIKEYLRQRGSTEMITANEEAAFDGQRKFGGTPELEDDGITEKEIKETTGYVRDAKIAMFKCDRRWKDFLAAVSAEETAKSTVGEQASTG